MIKLTSEGSMHCGTSKYSSQTYMLLHKDLSAKFDVSTFNIILRHNVSNPIIIVILNHLLHSRFAFCLFATSTFHFIPQALKTMKRIIWRLHNLI